MELWHERANAVLDDDLDFVIDYDEDTDIITLNFQQAGDLTYFLLRYVNTGAGD
jgi:hypothetical protein